MSGGLGGLAARHRLLHPGDPGYEAYAGDVVLRGSPQAVARPGSEAELADLLRAANDRRLPVTLAGGQTSLTGSSVALEGLLVSTEKMDRVLDVGRDADGCPVAVAEPGIFLGEFQEQLALRGWLYPPDPTSRHEARLGATVATNATGEESLRYGPTRRWVRELRVLTAGGETLTLRRRGAPPAEEKATAGYFAALDDIDLFIGSEGTLGAITRVTVALLPRPARVTAGLAFFPRLRDALEFVVLARRRLEPLALELLDRASLDLVGSNPEHIAWPPGTGAAIAFKTTVDPDDRQGLEPWIALLEECLARAGAGALLDRTLVMDDEPALARLRSFRHRVPATLNERIAGFRDAGGGKVGTDWWVPYDRLPDFLVGWGDRIREAGLEHLAFGHVGNGHPHVNFLARTTREVSRARELATAMCREAVALGGGVAGEHGLGKLKRDLLAIQYPGPRIEAMKAVKRRWDPRWILGRGNIFPSEDA
jgi:FAD/FMN-containing dehydrogenase